MSQKAQEILIKSRRKFYSHNLGNNPTAFVGNGMDFSELREYQPGDDVRKINHKASARMQKPYINLFTEERELNIVTVMLGSGSLYFGSADLKQNKVAEVIALLGFWALSNQDRVTTLIYTESDAYFRPPSKRMQLLDETIPHLVDFDTKHHKVDFDSLAHYLLGRISQKSLIFLVGDFYEVPDLNLLATKHELFCVVVRDRMEESPQLEGLFDLIDPQSGEVETVELNPSYAGQISRQFEAHDRQLFEQFDKLGIRSTKIYTDEDPFIKLREMVK